MPKLKNNFNELINKVACPFNALVADGSQCVCTYEIKVANKKIGNVCLGSIESEIESHCGSCPFKANKDEGSRIKEIKIDNHFAVKCPVEKCSVSVEESCKTCMFLSKKTLADKAKKDPDAVMEIIPCSFPYLPQDNIKVFLDKKTKEALKANKKQLL